MVALNGPEKLIGPGQTLRLPNVVPRSRDYGGAINDKQAQLMNMLNVAATSRMATLSSSTRAMERSRSIKGMKPDGTRSDREAGRASSSPNFR